MDISTKVIHDDLGNNLFWTRTVNQGDVNEAFKKSNIVEEVTLDFARQKKKMVGMVIT